jgi:hypothetical protein
VAYGCPGRCVAHNLAHQQSSAGEVGAVRSKEGDLGQPLRIIFSCMNSRLGE